MADFFVGNNGCLPGTGNHRKTAFTIGPEERRVLLAIARESIVAKLENRAAKYPDTDKYPVLKNPCGAFVTLHKTSAAGERALRGCIGRLVANMPLEETIRRMAVEAAFGDPRFPTLEREEFASCHIEISALSPMSPCPDPAQVEIGVHGLYLVFGGRSGVLLPQVPVEQGWNLEEYLDYICIKAGVPARSFDAPGAELYIFTAVVFGED